jgi:hypothetical protein
MIESMNESINLSILWSENENEGRKDRSEASKQASKRKKGMAKKK